MPATLKWIGGVVLLAVIAWIFYALVMRPHMARVESYFPKVKEEGVQMVIADIESPNEVVRSEWKKEIVGINEYEVNGKSVREEDVIHTQTITTQSEIKFQIRAEGIGTSCMSEGMKTSLGGDKTDIGPELMYSRSFSMTAPDEREFVIRCSLSSGDDVTRKIHMIVNN